jgi:hypothetical protein
LKTVKIYEDGQVARSLPLKKIKEDIYVTDPVSLDVVTSEVRLLGTDPEQKSFEKIIPALSNPNKRKITFHY